MDQGRERRESGTADTVYLPRAALDRLGGDGNAIDRIMAELAAECAAAEHSWADPETRTICNHCGAFWGPRSN